MRIHTNQQLLELLDQIVEHSPRGDRTSPAAGSFWAGLLTQTDHPLATRLPDESLVSWSERGWLRDLDGARVLDIGCGNGRNTGWFAERGADVLGIDISDELLSLAARSLPTIATVRHVDILRDPLPEGRFDFVYDSGCFHHIAPHRRATYLHRVLPLIAAGGGFGVVAFASETEGLVDDAEVLTTGDNGRILLLPGRVAAGLWQTQGARAAPYAV